MSIREDKIYGMTVENKLIHSKFKIKYLKHRHIRQDIEIREIKQIIPIFMTQNP